MPRILVLFVKLGAHILATVAARTLNMHIPLISTPLISFRLGVGVPPVSFRGNKVTVGIQRSEIRLTP